jgi:hypothetical protein
MRKPSKTKQHAISDMLLCYYLTGLFWPGWSMNSGASSNLDLFEITGPVSITA